MTIQFKIRMTHAVARSVVHPVAESFNLISVSMPVNRERHTGNVLIRLAKFL